MYDQAHEILQSIRDHELNLDLVTYNSLMDIYVRRGECWKAEEILNSLDNPSWDLVSYNTVITDFCRKGMMQEAVRMLSEMTGRGIRPCVFTYNTFVSGYTAMGMFGEIEDAWGLLGFGSRISGFQIFWYWRLKPVRGILDQFRIRIQISGKMPNPTLTISPFND
ncbi:unnamed protein product [Brassica oleracea]|uniref:Pentatricopeptide repeat-containing protein n=2 Tax=Brassica TaxID=3705 RepID=A0A3P6E1J7_BRAOL|nr:unnamed protein product [Brassica oleracea]